MARPRRKPPRSGALTELPPLKILRSILVLQLWYYTTFLILAVFTSLVLGQNFSPDLVLDWKSVRGDTTLGWTVGVLCVVNGFITYALSLPIRGLEHR
jgi:protein SYS1